MSPHRVDSYVARLLIKEEVYALRSRELRKVQSTTCLSKLSGKGPGGEKDDKGSGSDSKGPTSATAGSSVAVGA